MGWMFEDARRELKLDSSRAIVMGLGFRMGTRFKMKLPLSELIDDKISNEDKRFTYYVSIVEKIKNDLEKRYPFLNLENLDMNWTGKELETAVLKAYDEWIEEVSKLDKMKVEK